MKTNKEIFEELSRQYTEEELVESIHLNEELSPGEQKQANEEFLRLRLERLKQASPQEKLLSKLLQMKYLMQAYFRIEKFDPAFSFSKQLKQYVNISERSNKEIAGHLSVHPTKLSRLLNGKENPNIEFMYRLEKHSGGELPAHYWWRLFAREFEYEIKMDLETKLEEAEQVKQSLELPS